MNNAEEFILYNELYKLYDSTKNTSEPFTFWVKKIKTKNNNIFNGGGENNYSNVGIVKIGSSKSKSQFVGFLFTPRNFNSVRLYIEKRHSKEDDNKFIKAANDIGKKITVKQIEDFLKDISSKYESWKYDVTPDNNIDGALVAEMGKLYTDFFYYLKKYDSEKDTCFYEILKIKTTELDDNITKNKVLNSGTFSKNNVQETIIVENTKQLADILNAAKISTQYWKLNANPEIWDMRNLNIGDEIDYKTVDDNSNKLSNYQNAKQGDLVLGYLTGERKIVSLFIVSKPDKDDVIYFKKILNVEPNFLTLDEIKNNQKTQDAFKQLQTTFTKVEYNKFIEIISMMIKKGVLKLEDFQDAIKKIPDIINGDKCNISHPLNLILYGPPGTGKTYNTVNKALEIIDGTVPTSREDVKKRYDELVGKGQIVFTTFHQSMSYEDFIEGIKPKVDGDNMTYEVQDGIFKEICEKAKTITDNFDESWNKMTDDLNQNTTGIPIDIKGNDSFTIVLNQNGIGLTEPNASCTKHFSKKQLYNVYRGLPGIESKAYDNYRKAIVGKMKTDYGLVDYCKEDYSKLKKYVLIIDEINRGNVSQIFGELITLIEDCKRLGKSEAMSVTLPYSKNFFGVPQNVYILGTMNTADRSVEALDTALRRRFSFEEMMPNLKLLEGKIVCGIHLDELLKIINKRIVALKDREHQIGHSYFMPSEEDKKYEKEWLKKIFKDKIIPLLQEYFYGDYKKMLYVLGSEFVKIDAENKFDIFPVKIEDDYDIDIQEKNYEIITIDENFDIVKAINELMKKTATNEKENN